MKKSLLLLIVLLGGISLLHAQKYFTKEGRVSFFSNAPMEKIEASNSTAVSVVDTESGRIEFAVLIKAFQFEKALMQEHFNENYMESSKYPKATFKGQIVNMDAIDFSKDGNYTSKVKGDLTIHGETRPVEADAKFTVQKGNVSATSSFNVKVADYNIEIPAVVRDNVAKEVKIDVEADYQKMKS